MMRSIITLFVPPVFNNYYLLPTTKISVFFKNNAVIGIVTLLKGTSITIEHYLQEPYDETIKDPLAQKATALQLLLKKLPPCDTLNCALPGTTILFKELTLPFTDTDKIDAVLYYELEPVLPFPLSQVYFDYCILQQDKEKQSSTIMVAALQQTTLHYYESIIKTTHISNVEYTVDVLTFYNACKRFLNYYHYTTSCFFSFDEETIKLLFFEKSKLKNIRILPIGEQAESILQTKAWQDLILTLQSFLDTQSKKIDCMFFIDTSVSPLIKKELSALFKATIQTFSHALYTETTDIVFNESTKEVPLPTLLGGVPFSDKKIIQLQAPEVIATKNKREQLHLIIAFILCFSSLSLFGLHLWKRINTYETELKESSNQLSVLLKKTFPSIKGSSITTLIDASKKELKKELEIWSSFSTTRQQSFLEYLFILSTQIDKDSLGLILTKMNITKNTITLEGSVQDYPDLGNFENQLKKTNLFTQIPDLQEKEFKITLPLHKKGTLL